MTADQEILATLQDVVTRLAALETAVAGSTGKDKKQSRGISFDSAGGKKVGHPLPVQTENEISFESIGGKVVRRAKDHPTVKANTRGMNESEGSIGVHASATEAVDN
jgi:hypothetical protein